MSKTRIFLRIILIHQEKNLKILYFVQTRVQIFLNISSFQTSHFLMVHIGIAALTFYQELAKFLRTRFLQNISGRLLLNLQVLKIQISLPTYLKMLKIGQNLTEQCCYALFKNVQQIIVKFQQLFTKTLFSYILQAKTLFINPDEREY